MSGEQIREFLQGLKPGDLVWVNKNSPFDNALRFRIKVMVWRGRMMLVAESALQLFYERR